MRLDNGIEIQFEAVHIDQTYCGLLLGMLDENMNRDEIEAVQEHVGQYWGVRPIHLVEPDIKVVEGNSLLPQFCIRAWFKSKETRHGDGTELVVILYTDRNPYKESIEDILFEKIHDLNWLELSEEFQF